MRLLYHSLKPVLFQLVVKMGVFEERIQCMVYVKRYLLFAYFLLLVQIIVWSCWRVADGTVGYQTRFVFSELIGVFKKFLN